MSNWLTYSPVSGHGNTTITITASTLTGLEDRIATLVATGSQEGQTLSATTVITQKYATLTEIYFENLTWVTDIPYTGGTATSANCSFSIIAKYSDNSTKDITNLANVTGSIFVPYSNEGERRSAGTLTLTATYEDKTCYGNVVAYQQAFDFSKKPLTFNIISGGTINWRINSNIISKTIEYKLNNGEWIATENAEVTVSAGDKIQFRGNNATYGSENSIFKPFSNSTAVFAVEGNIMSLINSTDFDSLTALEGRFTFADFFRDCTGLTSAKNLILPATTLGTFCYQDMFRNCTSLTTAPKELPATTLTIGCYGGMFNGCTSLITVPELPATTLIDGCYQGMFQGCTSLTTVPSNLLPATTFANSCYQSMFRGCTSLTTAPELPATDLETRCYSHMFYNCTSLNYIKCLAIYISQPYCTDSWVYGVAPTGTFVQNPNLSVSDWPTGTSGVPKGWTVVNNS